jgi:tight adherence protein C
MDTLTSILVIEGIGTALLVFWLFLYFKGRSYAPMFDAITEKDYPLKEIYFVGYAFLNLIGYSYTNGSDRKLRQFIEVLHERRYVDFYLRVIRAQQVTMGLTVLLLAFVTYGLTLDLMFFGLVVLVSGLAFWYYSNVVETKINVRKEEMMRDFSEVVSKLALLTSSGMILREAWTVTGNGGDSVIYEEMLKADQEMENGMSETDAILQFGRRSMLPEIKKFSSTVTQGVIKGSAELSDSLREQSQEVWEIKKQLVKRQGEKAASKLMIPMMIMFVGILILILVPAFSNMSF